MSSLDPTSDPFDDLLDSEPEAAARELTQLLALDAPGRREETDARAVQILENRSMGDELIEHVNLDVLHALGERLVEQQRSGPPRPDDERRWEAWSFLDAIRRSSLLVRIRSANAVDLWSDLILRLVEASHFTFGPLFEQRVAGYGSRTLFEIPGSSAVTSVSWNQVAGRVGLIARGLVALTSGCGDKPIAILSENRLEMALTDLACLTTGIVNVMIPATATESEVGYIVGHSGAGTIIVSNSVQLKKIEAHRGKLPKVDHVVVYEGAAASARDVIEFDEILGRAIEVSAEDLGEKRASASIDDLATVMYTSGTTGRPKGIRFSQRNIVFKRFARALALPEIGEDDRFLCYLPLFHTFGRFLELCGSVFWGATYRFAESPSIDGLVREMQNYRPTVFISIPMKWIQLYERIRQEVDVESSADDEIVAAVDLVTGGKLRWGLSAAGYLDPEVFRFFQRYGVELMSGFGMTEATGGITMTVPEAYVENSLGVPLPGIRTELADDGELVIRGPYVMMGYLDDPEGRPAFDEEGWFHTGDLMEQDTTGQFHMVDRKKEIYKNVKGQTIAPQKIENLFRDFDSVGRIFLAGDHRPYNTALIYPNFDFQEVDLKTLDARERKAHYRSLVVSANAFLSPFERIVDFAVVDRDFDPDLGELTPKGTYRRKVIERNFADTIQLLYRRTTLSLGGAEVTVPNWLFQALGITAQELEIETDRLTLGSVGSPLTILSLGGNEIQIGSVVYVYTGRGSLDLGLVLSTPLLWLGNSELVDFAPLATEHRDRRRRREPKIDWLRHIHAHSATPGDRDILDEIHKSDEIDLMALHHLACLMNSTDTEIAEQAVDLLEDAIETGEGELTDTTLSILRHAASCGLPDVSRHAFRVLTLTDRPALYPQTLRLFIDAVPDLFDDETGAALNEHELSPETVETLIRETDFRFQLGIESEASMSTATSMLQFLAHYGASHPARYRQLRAFLTRMSIAAPSVEGTRLARHAITILNDGFRHWLGRPSRIAVDPETGLEYRWDDVVAFAEDVDDEAKHRLLAAIKNTNMLQEGIFLFSRGSAVRLDDILPGGVWIRLLGTEHGKSVYRMAVKTRNLGQFDLAINLNRDLAEAHVLEEIDWLVVCAGARDLGPLVEDFGGYWPEHGLWTEEFIPGETLDRAVARLSRKELDAERLESLWPFAAWSAMSAYVDFWNRTGRRLMVEDPTPGNVIVPTHDYHAGARLVSIAARTRFDSMLAMLERFMDQLILPVESMNPRLEGVVGWDIVFSSVLEIVGEVEGRELLTEVAARAHETGCDFAGQLDHYLEVVATRGFLPRRLFFAAKRFRKWDRLALDATHTIRARTLQDLYETYRLAELRASYPESRARFFRETVLRDVPKPLAEGLERIISDLRSRRMQTDDLSSAVADLRAHLELDAEDDYFLARLSYPYLRPEDDAEYVASVASGVQHSEMVVTFDDPDGRIYGIRHALNPKEIARLHRLFLAAKLPVHFRQEHRFLVAVSDRGHLLGGLFYELEPEAQTAHMEKVVVAESARAHGVAGHLLDELSNRLKAENYRWLTTGFFRPQFFYRYGFTVERRYAGLVRSLQDEDGEG